MGAVMSFMTRKVQRINIENRAHKFLSRDKPTPAPQYKAAIEQLRVAKEVNPHFMEEHSKKNAQLDNYLKDVYITSQDPEEKVIEANPNRPLPMRRTTGEDFEYGVFEPAVVSKGKCTLRQAVEFIANHNSDPEKFSASEIAAQYKLSPKTTENILKYFRTFHIYIPETGSKDMKLAEPEMKKIDEK